MNILSLVRVNQIDYRTIVGSAALRDGRIENDCAILVSLVLFVGCSSGVTIP